MSDECHFCGETEVLQEHHIVPRRLNGTDESVNLVTLCPTCHRKIESMYDKRFYDTLGVEKPEEAEVEITEGCWSEGCTATSDHELTCPHDGGSMYLCDSHKECGFEDCEKRGVTPIQYGDYYAPLCDEHRVCQESGCENYETRLYRSDAYDDSREIEPTRVLCTHHAFETSPWWGDEWVGVWDDE